MDSSTLSASRGFPKMTTIWSSRELAYMGITGTPIRTAIFAAHGEKPIACPNICTSIRLAEESRLSRVAATDIPDFSMENKVRDNWKGLPPLTMSMVVSMRSKTSIAILVRSMVDEFFVINMNGNSRFILIADKRLPKLCGTAITAPPYSSIRSFIMRVSLAVNWIWSAADSMPLWYRLARVFVASKALLRNLL